MYYRINENCRACNTCVANCPVQAVEPDYPYYRIREWCTGCGLCYKLCAFGAIDIVDEIGGTQAAS